MMHHLQVLVLTMPLPTATDIKDSRKQMRHYPSKHSDITMIPVILLITVVAVEMVLRKMCSVFSSVFLLLTLNIFYNFF